MAALEISTRMNVGAVTEIDAVGAIDAHTSHEMDELFDELFEAGEYRVIMTLDRLTYISSAGVGVLIGAVQRCQENDGEIVFVKPSGSVREVFDLIGLNEMFQIVPTLKEARAFFEM